MSTKTTEEEQLERAHETPMTDNGNKRPNPRVDQLVEDGHVRQEPGKTEERSPQQPRNPRT